MKTYAVVGGIAFGFMSQPLYAIGSLLTELNTENPEIGRLIT
jgi:hypothetical protein